MDELKVAVLRHYASPYYDPEKAHEYYMRTRELKGRSTTSLNDEGKKIWSYTKNNIKSEKGCKGQRRAGEARSEDYGTS